MHLHEIITVNLIGTILLLNIIIGSRTRLRLRITESRLSLALLLICMGGCITDPIVWIVDGKSGIICYCLNLLGNTYLYFANIFIGIFWVMFLDYHFNKDNAQMLRHARYFAIPYSLLTLILLINLRIPIVFELGSDNRYTRLPFSLVYFASAALIMLYSWIRYRIYQRKNGKQRFMFVGLFLIPTALGSGYQMLFYGYSLIWVGIAVGLAGASMALHNEYAYKDSLTGLYNREFLDYYLLSASRKKNSRICGMMLDADDFKSINDQYGHSEGDEALLLRMSLVKGSIAFRYAGDEFIILKDSGSMEDLQEIDRKLKQNLEDYNAHAEKPYRLSLSWGIAEADLTQHSVDEFQKQMDKKMYKTKRERKCESSNRT